MAVLTSNSLEKRLDKEITIINTTTTITSIRKSNENNDDNIFVLEKIFCGCPSLSDERFNLKDTP